MNEADEFSKVNAIYLLGDLGLNEDVQRLEKLLDFKFKIFVAKTLLRKFASDADANLK